MSTIVSLKVIVQDIREKANAWRQQADDELRQKQDAKAKEARRVAAVLDMLANDYEDLVA